MLHQRDVVNAHSTQSFVKDKRTFLSSENYHALRSDRDATATYKATKSSACKSDA